MAMVMCCDRCSAQCTNPERVLDFDLCKVCVRHLRTWVSYRGMPVKSAAGRPSHWWPLIERYCETHGTVNASGLAMAHGVSHRGAIEALGYHFREGQLTRMGKGVYRLRNEASQCVEAVDGKA